MVNMITAQSLRSPALVGVRAFDDSAPGALRLPGLQIRV